jgi:hypothetical protein
MTIHSRIPQILRRETGYIGEPPLANEIGLALAKDFHYLNCWAQNYQLFSFWQPALDPNHGDQCVATTQIAYCDGNYYVILCSPPKIDTSNPQRSLQGALLPWASMGFKTVGGGLDWEEWPTITWQQTGEAAETLYDNKASSLEVSADLAKDKRLPWKNPIMLGGAGQFLWTPDAAGGFTWGVLTTHQIRTAALGIWPGPDWDLTAAQARFNTAKFAQGHGIRGYTTTAAKNSLGNIVHTQGTAKVDDDDLYQNARRTCLMQWGHPQGIWTDNSAAYVNIRNANTTYKTPARGWRNQSYSSTFFVADVAAIVTVSGAAAGNPAYLRIISVTGADSVAIAKITNTTSLITGEIDLATAGGEIMIELKAPVGWAGPGEITLHTLSLWDKANYFYSFI